MPASLMWVAKAVGGEEEAVAVAGLGFADVDEPGIGSGRAGLFERHGADLGDSGHAASSSVPKRASVSEQEVLPSAALGLIEKPSGRSPS